MKKKKKEQKKKKREKELPFLNRRNTWKITDPTIKTPTRKNTIVT